MRTISNALSWIALLVAACTLLEAQSANLAEESGRARDLMAAGRYKEAIPLYVDLVKALPGNSGVVSDLGLALHMAGREDDAVIQFKKALKLDPANVAAELYLGYAYLSLGEPEKAIEPLEKAVRAGPTDAADPDARENLGEALIASRRYEAAAGQFEKLSQLQPKNAEAWYQLGLSYQSLSQQAFNELEKIAPGSAYWLALAADSRAKAMQYSSAFYLYNQAIAKDPRLREAHAALAEIYEKTGHAGWAKIESEREQKLGPPDCGVEPAACAFRARRYQELAATGSNTPAANYWKTKAYQKLAVQAFAHLGQLPPSPQLHELLASIRADELQNREAVEEWKSAYELSGGNAEIGKQLVSALLQIQSFSEAEKLLRALLPQRPDSAELNYLLGFTLLNLKQAPDAAHYLERALELDSGLLPAHRVLAEAYLAMGESAKALPQLRAALPIDSDGSIHYQLARAYQSQGETALARAMLKQYEQIHNAREAEQQNVQKEVQITAPGPG